MIVSVSLNAVLKLSVYVISLCKNIRCVLPASSQGVWCLPRFRSVLLCEAYIIIIREDEEVRVCVITGRLSSFKKKRRMHVMYGVCVCEKPIACNFEVLEVIYLIFLPF